MSEQNAFGVIGAGQMGRGIAQVAASCGFRVCLLDASPALAAQGRERIEKNVSRQVERGKIREPDARALLERIRPTASYSELADAEFVVEAASERLEVKKAIFEKADKAMNDRAVLASNTSSISLTKLAAATQHPERVVGMHFMNPVPRMKLVEVIRALQTSDETFARTKQFAEQLGKTVVCTKDMPGFIVNRMLIPFLNEACFALQEGLGTVEDIDAATRLGLNHPMGPFELSDLIGLDTVLSIAEVLHREFGEDKYRPPAILRNYVAAGWLGRKSRRGFYLYDEKGVSNSASTGA